MGGGKWLLVHNGNPVINLRVGGELEREGKGIRKLQGGGEIFKLGMGKRSK